MSEILSNWFFKDPFKSYPILITLNKIQLPKDKKQFELFEEKNYMIEGLLTTEFKWK